MNRSVLSFVIGSVLVAGWSLPAFGCLCAPVPPVAELIAESTAVFSGRVVAIERMWKEENPQSLLEILEKGPRRMSLLKMLEEQEAREKRNPGPPSFEQHLKKNGVRVMFAVDAVWVGPHAPRIELFVAGCEIWDGVGFRVGESYVVFVQQLPGGTLTTSACSRTKRTARAAEELGVLGVATWRPTP